MGIVERKQRQRENLRQQILDAALDVFATEGFQRVSMRRLAEKIEYSPSTIYMHFTSKDDLFECVCEQTFAQLSDMFAEIVGSCQDPLEVLQKCCRAYIDFGLTHPQQYTVAFLLTSHPGLEPTEVSKHFPRAMEAFYQLRTEIVHCMAIGHFDDVDPDLISQVIWASLHGLTALLIQKPSFPWCEKERLIDAMIGMIQLLAPSKSADSVRASYPEDSAPGGLRPV